MTFISLVIFGIILILVTIYIIVYVIYPSTGNNDLLRNITQLSTKTDLLYSDETKKQLLATSGSSIMGYFNIQSGDRTQKLGDSFIPLLQVENNWYLEISPAPKHKSDSSARLRINTVNSGKFEYESIELPSIPKQKWMFIAILRDGRRFDVIYNNRIVASHILANYPSVISSPLSIGNTGLDGSVIHIIINNTRLSLQDVERERLSHIDTNDNVLEDNIFSFNFPGINLFAECPPGLPCDPITNPPSNNLLQWSTPYA
jgi:hypothetical protein